MKEGAELKERVRENVIILGCSQGIPFYRRDPKDIFGMKSPQQGLVRNDKAKSPITRGYQKIISFYT